MTFPWDAKRGDVRAYLTTMAEVDRWELDRVKIFRDGRRWVRVRRKIYHLQRTG